MRNVFKQNLLLNQLSKSFLSEMTRPSRALILFVASSSDVQIMPLLAKNGSTADVTCFTYLVNSNDLS